MIEDVECFRRYNSGVEEVENLHVAEHIEENSDKLSPISGNSITEGFSRISNFKSPNGRAEEQVDNHNGHLIEDHAVDLSPVLLCQNIVSLSHWGGPYNISMGPLSG